ATIFPLPQRPASVFPRSRSAAVEADTRPLRRFPFREVLDRLIRRRLLYAVSRSRPIRSLPAAVTLRHQPLPSRAMDPEQPLQQLSSLQPRRPTLWTISL